MNTELLIPGRASAYEASLWVGLLSLNGPPRAPAEAWIDAGDGLHRPIADWRSWTVPDGQSGLITANVTIDHLRPRTRQQARLHIDGRIVALDVDGPGHGRRSATVYAGTFRLPSSMRPSSRSRPSRMVSGCGGHPGT